MPSSDLRPDRALIVSQETVEAVDIDEHLSGQGWGPNVLVRTVEEAMALVVAQTPETRVFSLAVIGLAITRPGVESLLAICREQSVRALCIDGETGSIAPDQIAVLARPFSTRDLEASLESLGFLRT